MPNCILGDVTKNTMPTSWKSISFVPGHKFAKGDTAFEVNAGASHGFPFSGSYSIEELAITSFGNRQGTATVKGTNLLRRLYVGTSLLCRTHEEAVKLGRALAWRESLHRIAGAIRCTYSAMTHVANPRPGVYEKWEAELAQALDASPNIRDTPAGR